MPLRGDVWALYNQHCERLLKPRTLILEGESGNAARVIISSLHESLRILAAEVLDPIISSIYARLSKAESRLQNLEFALAQIGEIADRGKALEKATCEDCGAEIPHGLGIGFSTSEDEWTDKSKPRGIHITPLCKSCISKRLVIESNREAKEGS